MSMLPDLDNEGDPFHNPNLIRALRDYPFRDILESRRSVDDPEGLDHLALALQESRYMKLLESQLSDSPRYSALYRYDPFSITSQDTFAGRISNGAGTAWLRLFSDLTFDKIKVVRMENETLVVIDHPSVLISSEEATREVNEPTVLFTSRQLARSLSPEEEMALGVTFRHNDKLLEVQPDSQVGNNGINLGLYRHMRNLAKQA